MKASVLIVEPSPVVRKELSRILSQEDGLNVVFFGNVIDALNYLKGQKVDLFICDYKAPPLGALKLSKKLKEDPALRAIPLYFTMGILDQVSEKDLEELGALGAIFKPFRAEEVLSKFRKALGLEGETEEVIELTEVVEEEGEIPEAEASRLKEILEESAKELEMAESSIAASPSMATSPFLAEKGQGELEIAFRKFIEALVRELAKAFREELRRLIEEEFKKGVDVHDGAEKGL